MKHLGDVQRRRCWMLHLRLVWDIVRTYWLYAVVIYSLDVVTTIVYPVIETYHGLAVKCLISDVPATLLRHTKWCCWSVVTTFSCRVEDAPKHFRQKVMIVTLLIFWFSYFWSILLKSLYNPYLHVHYKRQLVKLVIGININCWYELTPADAYQFLHMFLILYQVFHNLELPDTA